MRRHQLRLAIAILLALAVSAQADNTSSEAPNPALVVWAKTKLANQSQPTLDLLDVERYFVQQLAERRIENALPSSTAHIPNPAAPNTFFLEVSVDALREAKRAESTMGNAYRPSEFSVFCVDLSLAVKHQGSGRVRSILREYHEVKLGQDHRTKDEDTKRAALAAAIEKLAAKFVDAAAEGRLGNELVAIQAPIWTRITAWHVVIGIFGGLIILVVLGLIISIVGEIAGDAERREQDELRRRWDRRLKDVELKAVETDNFSEKWYRAAAQTHRDDLLAQAARIREQEADRRIRAARILAEHEEIAAYAQREHGCNNARVVTLLRNAEAHEHRLLQEANRIKNETEEHHA